MEYYTEKSEIGNSYIEFMYDTKMANVWIVNMHIDLNLPKTIFMALRNAIDAFTENEYKFIFQKVTHADWNDHLSRIKGWELHRIYDDIIVIKCDINNAITTISKSLGFGNEFGNDAENNDII